MPTEQEDPLGYWCALIGHEYLGAMRRRLGHLGIDRWFFVLARMAEVEGPITQQQLADELRLDKVAMMRAIDHLQSHGYVKRKVCQADRRKHHLELQPKAKPAVKDVQQACAPLNELALGSLKATERQKLFMLLEKMGDRLHRADEQEDIPHKPGRKPN